MRWFICPLLNESFIFLAAIILLFHKNVNLQITRMLVRLDWIKFHSTFLY
ncbi:hypothetical protein CLOSTMETH_01902 [[Clostridium] methylpentosum DSM 5476]|uniref:Uncharacterized protein n=1 Tax=[Clostridium] methylpentosum DSM 5476 TaxID=537013 RepID=C0EDH6_9FIRM|nr:hypothetical protein CLOSTMETH_01902 [[Clostridium] methylpentosum DSM 5476]